MWFNLIYFPWIDMVTIALFTVTVTSVSLFVKHQQQQQSDQEKSSQSSASSTPVATVPSPPSPSDSNGQDEYHEDEDSISLDNLFPCDQSEIHASSKITYIIEELIQTEVNYVDNLKRGVRNYGHVFDRKDLPESLQGKREDLLGNIEEILLLHEKEVLPMMHRNQRDLKVLFDEFAGYVDKNYFYSYVIFTMNKKTSMQLRQDHREYLAILQTELNDKLGIDSFLVQPIQRLTRYPLLLQQFISEFYKAGINCKPVLMACCKLETRLRHLLTVVNQSEEIKSIDELNEIDILEQGYFRKSGEFDAFHHKSRKKYRAKVFLFDKCLLCTEVKKKRLSYRCHYSWESIEVAVNNSKSLQVKHRIQNRAEYDFIAAESNVIRQWMRCIVRVTSSVNEEIKLNGKLTIPMEAVLGIGFAIWLMFRFL